MSSSSSASARFAVTLANTGILGGSAAGIAAGEEATGAGGGGGGGAKGSSAEEITTGLRERETLIQMDRRAVRALTVK
jgi:hypothetical protein